MNKKKILLIICDGLGDLPISEFNNKTPLEAANTPNLDKLSFDSKLGYMYVLGKGVRPNSDEAHLTLFGYKLPENYPGRGPIEACGVGIRLENGDVAIRANLATVNEELGVIDRRAGRIENGEIFVKDLNGIEIDGIKFIVKAGTGHRIIIVMRGNGLSDKIGNSDVHYVTETEIVEDWMGKKVNEIKPLDDSKEAIFTAKILQKFLVQSYDILSKNPENNNREFKANYFLTRGPGYYKQLINFKEKYGLKAACIAGAGLYKGLGVMAGMELINVDGATGLPNTNVRAKIEKAMEEIQNYDFLFVHIKPTDIFGENGDCVGKKNFIEKIDMALEGIDEVEAKIVITADHSTPCSHKDHSIDPVPVLIYEKNIEGDKISKFGEENCRNGSLGEIEGKDFMDIILK